MNETPSPDKALIGVVAVLHAVEAVEIVFDIARTFAFRNAGVPRQALNVAHAAFGIGVG